MVLLGIIQTEFQVTQIQRAIAPWSSLEKLELLLPNPLRLRSVAITEATIRVKLNRNLIPAPLNQKYLLCFWGEQQNKSLSYVLPLNDLELKAGPPLSRWCAYSEYGMKKQLWTVTASGPTLLIKNFPESLKISRVWMFGVEPSRGQTKFLLTSIASAQSGSTVSPRFEIKKPH